MFPYAPSRRVRCARPAATRRSLLPAACFTLLVALAAFLPCVRAAGGFGIGALPVSRTAVSMWLLAGSDGGTSQPILLVYFTGPADWHQRRWETKFEGNLSHDARVTYRLVSTALTLDIEASADRKKFWVQGQEFSASENNVFVVENATDPKRQRVEKLGHFSLPADSAEPLPLAVLRAHPAVASRVGHPGFAGAAADLWPEQAILAAAEHADGIAGMFRIEVRGAGRKDGWLYLNSEADYRDQRCLTVALSPSAARTLEEFLHGDPAAVLRGQMIRVCGTAQRVKIRFTVDGRPTEQYYYQTQIRVTAASALTVVP